MRQHINLYQPVFGEQRKPLSASMFAIVLGVAIASLAAYSGYSAMQLSKVRQHVESLRAQQSEQEAQFAADNEQLALREEPVQIESRVKKLERALAERRAALAILQSGAAGQAIGFAPRMEALARRHVEGLWIDKLVLSGTNGTMSLSGATLDADIVPAYLHNLALESVLSGARFDEFVIERPSAAASSLAGSDDDEATKKPAPGSKHIRFRAGNKALTTTPVDTEAST
jgi:hypothetical protein